MERFYWYAWDNRNVVTMLMVEEDKKTLTPAAKAYAQIQEWLIGSRMKRCEPDQKNTWMCELTSEEGKPFWIVWNPKQKQNLVIPENTGVRQVRHLDGTITAMPNHRRLKVGRLPVLLSQL
jgi:hypothetical protein